MNDVSQMLATNPKPEKTRRQGFSVIHQGHLMIRGPKYSNKDGFAMNRYCILIVSHFDESCYLFGFKTLNHWKTFELTFYNEFHFNTKINWEIIKTNELLDIIVPLKDSLIDKISNDEKNCDHLEIFHQKNGVEFYVASPRTTTCNNDNKNDSDNKDDANGTITERSELEEEKNRNKIKMKKIVKKEVIIRNKKSIDNVSDQFLISSNLQEYNEWMFKINQCINKYEEKEKEKEKEKEATPPELSPSLTRMNDNMCDDDGYISSNSSSEESSDIDERRYLELCSVVNENVEKLAIDALNDDDHIIIGTKQPKTAIIIIIYFLTLFFGIVYALAFLPTKDATNTTQPVITTMTTTTPVSSSSSSSDVYEKEEAIAASSIIKEEAEEEILLSEASKANRIEAKEYGFDPFNLFDIFDINFEYDDSGVTNEYNDSNDNNNNNKIDDLDYVEACVTSLGIIDDDPYLLNDLSQSSEFVTSQMQNVSDKNRNEKKNENNKFVKMRRLTMMLVILFVLSIGVIIVIMVGGKTKDYYLNEYDLGPKWQRVNDGRLSSRW